MKNKQISKRMKKLKERSEYKHVPFGMTREKVLELIESRACYYCGDEFKSYHREIDRIVPEAGYVDDNVVMACNSCNRIKSNMVYNDKRYKQMVNIINKLNNT